MKFKLKWNLLHPVVYRYVAAVRVDALIRIIIA